MRTFHLLGKPLNSTEQPVGFMANYEEEITQELTEAKNQKQSGPANAFFFHADFAHSTIT